MIFCCKLKVGFVQAEGVGTKRRGEPHINQRLEDMMLTNIIDQSIIIFIIRWKVLCVLEPDIQGFWVCNTDSPSSTSQARVGRHSVLVVTSEPLPR